MRLHRLLAVGLLVFPVVLAGQADTVTLRIVPTPGQVLHSRMTLEMTMGFETAGDLPPGLTKPTHATMNIDMTTTVGTPDEQGRYQAHGMIDAASMVLTIDGQARPLENSLGKLVGTDMTMTYAADGRMLDIATTPALPGADVVKTMLTGATGLDAPVSLTVGETVTRPFAFSTLIASSANQGVGMSGEQQLTLVSIAPDGADRIAHVTTKLSSSASFQPAATGPGAPFAMAGTGTMDVNVDRGIVTRLEQHMDMTSALPMPTAATQPSMPRMHAVVTMTMTTESR
jgi:hypothetical protein